MARKTEMAIALAALLVAGGCKNQQQAANGTTPHAAVAKATLSPEELGELGAKIEHHPADARRILGERGLTDDAFAAQVRKVAEDPKASRRYKDAYKRTARG
jgi:hypothetical protein